MEVGQPTNCCKDCKILNESHLFQIAVNPSVKLWVVGQNKVSKKFSRLHILRDGDKSWSTGEGNVTLAKYDFLPFESCLRFCSVDGSINNSRFSFSVN